MNRIKIAHIITDLDIGGAEIMLFRTLCNASDKYEHFVISLLSIGSVGNMIKKKGYKIYTLNLKRWNFPISFMKLILILKNERPHIVHNYLFHADILGRIAATIMRVPIVISSLRNENIGGRLRERILGMTDFCVDKVTAVSQNVAKTHISKGTTRKDKISVIYNGLELSDDRPTDISSLRQNMHIGNDSFILLTIASLEIKKGHIFLLNTVEILKGKGYNIMLIIVGEGRERNRLEEEIINKRLNNEVILTGEKNNISELLSMSNLFILPSIWEGLPNALLEAMAAGLPVIATRVGGVPEVITDNETGLLVESKDSGALAEAIERMIKDGPLRERLAQRAKACVKKNFDIKNTVIATEKLYEELTCSNKWKSRK